MANVNAPFGFRPTMRTFSGAGGTVRPCHKLVGDGTALFINDAVQPAANGTKPTQCVKAAASTNCPVAGVNLIYGALSTATDHAMVVASGGLFITQGDGTGATYLIATQMNMNAEAAYTAGNAGTKISQHELSETSLLGTAALTLRVHGLYQAPDNAFGQYARVFVSFNNLADSDQKAGI